MKLVSTKLDNDLYEAFEDWRWSNRMTRSEALRKIITEKFHDVVADNDHDTYTDSDGDSSDRD